MTEKTMDAADDPIIASTSSTPPGFEPVIDPTAQPSMEDRLLGETEEQRGISLYFIIGGTVIVLLFIALTAFLYLLGGDDQSALERLMNIAVIYIVFMSSLIVLLLAASTVAFVYLILTLRDKALPAMDELTATLKRVRGTTEFMSEEAVKPVIQAAGKAAQVSAAFRVFRNASKRKW
ncbi:MAG TPA: hypothetical protein VFP05_00465 [Thermomicrobiales bacterium]|nr:hypothetical protein [Thermomicrobiales bacterium]